MFNKRHLTLKLVVAALLLWTFLFPLYARHLFQAPLNEPLSVSPPGTVQTSFHIPLAEDYFFGLAFARNGLPSQRLREIIGEGHNQEGKRGLPIAVKLEIYSLAQKRLIVDQEIVTADSFLWTPEYVIRKIRLAGLPPGDYELGAAIMPLTAENGPVRIGTREYAGPDPYEEFRPLPPDLPGTRLLLRLEPSKDMRTPVGKLILWHGILLWPVIWVLDVALSVLLLYRIWQDRKWTV